MLPVSLPGVSVRSDDKQALYYSGFLCLYYKPLLAVMPTEYMKKVSMPAMKKAGELRKANPKLTQAEAVKKAWKTPEILAAKASR